MPVTAADLLHVAALARLRLTSEELARFTPQLGDVLAHVAELAEADTAGIEPEPATEWAAAIPPEALAPAWRDGFFTVPRLAGMEEPPEREAGT
jgi:Asp-tRNA(Asn)/Glu-tRNA(Gln) amidotransferase C subunit